MKRLFCTTITDGALEHPIILHIKAESSEHAEKCARKHLLEEYDGDPSLPNFDSNNVDDIFDIFTFEVGEAIEA
jgi:hypothetical protein